jgi:hypothetical protein
MAGREGGIDAVKCALTNIDPKKHTDWGPALTLSLSQELGKLKLTGALQWLSPKFTTLGSEERNDLRGWSWYRGRGLGVPESNAARLSNRDKKVMIKVHPGLSTWRSILGRAILDATRDLGVDTAFIDVTLVSHNLQNCFVETVTPTEGMNKLIHHVATVGQGLGDDARSIGIRDDHHRLPFFQLENLVDEHIIFAQRRRSHCWYMRDLRDKLRPEMVYLLDDRATFEMVQKERPGISYFDPEYQEILKKKSLKAIKEHPGWFLTMLPRRFLRMLSSRNDWGFPIDPGYNYSAFKLRGESLSSYIRKTPMMQIIYRIVIRVVENGLVFMAFAGAILLRKRWRHFVILISVPACGFLMHLPIHWESRYLLPGNFPFLILTAVSIGAFYRWAKTHRTGASRE